MGGLPFRPVRAKPDCLNLLGVMRRLRTKNVVKVAEFVKKFPWLSFALQAPQVTADIWGVGLQLGSVMGFVSDTIWSMVRVPFGGSVNFRGPPPSDPLGKAVNYLAAPTYHHGRGAVWDYADHWLLLAADAIAIRIVMENFSPSVLEGRVDEVLAAPVLYHEPWHPATIEVLSEKGFVPGGEYASPFVDLPARPTYGQALGYLGDSFPQYLSSIRSDFPASVSSTAYANVLAELAEEILTWGLPEKSIGSDVFDVFEYTLARFFEYGIFPPSGTEAEAIELMIERSIEIAEAMGQLYPGRVAMEAAAQEVWGGYLSV